VIVGITTAATIWAVAAIGLSIGAGLYLVAIVTTVITLIALRFLAPPRTHDKK
jgi:putative Mg2+ transporter-C (MgtC) family protein